MDNLIKGLYLFTSWRFTYACAWISCRSPGHTVGFGRFAHFLRLGFEKYNHNICHSWFACRRAQSRVGFSRQKAKSPNAAYAPPWLPLSTDKLGKTEPNHASKSQVQITRRSNDWEWSRRSVENEALGGGFSDLRSFRHKFINLGFSSFWGLFISLVKMKKNTGSELERLQSAAWRRQQLQSFTDIFNKLVWWWVS